MGSEGRSGSLNPPGPAAQDSDCAVSVPDHELLHVIGQGSYGQVWLAKSITGSLRAVKIVRNGSGETNRAFDREFKGIQHYEPISRLHPNLMPVLHVGHRPNDGFFYYVMELADRARDESGTPRPGLGDEQSESPSGESGVGQEGEEEFRFATYSPRTLRGEIQRRGRLPVRECAELGVSITGALEILHERGLVHRDVKPSNIIFVGGTPKLADVGLVAPSDATLSLVGTPGYLPEKGPNSPSADFYALGQVLYEASTGNNRQRFADPPTSVLDNAENAAWAELNEVLLKACASEPSQRYQTAADLRADLLLVLTGRSLRRIRFLERNMKWAWAFGMAAVVVALATFLFQKSQTNHERERTALSEANEREQRRQVFLEKARSIGPSLRFAGWSERAMRNLIQASEIRKDASVRDQVVASLSGLDAELVYAVSNFSACSVAFDLSGTRLLAGGIDEGARLWSFGTDTFHTSNAARPGPVTFSSDNTPLQFVATEHGAFTLWDPERQRTIRDFRISDLKAPGRWPGWVEVPMAMTPDGSRLAGSAAFKDDAGAYVAWDAASGRVLLRGSGKPFAVAFSHDGSMLAAGHDDGSIAVWSVTDGREIVHLKDESFSIRSLAFARDVCKPRGSSNGKEGWLLAAGDEVGAITVWDLNSLNVRRRLEGSAHHVYALAFSPNQVILASAGRYEARLWDVASGRLLLAIPAGDAHTGIAFSRDGKGLAISNRSAFLTGAVRVYELKAGRGIAALHGLRGPFGAVAFSPRGRWLAAVSADWRIGIWDVETGFFHRSFPAPKGAFPEYTHLQFSPDETRVAYLNNDSQKPEVVIWNIDSAECESSWRSDHLLVSVLSYDENCTPLLFTAEEAIYDGLDSAEKHGNVVCRVRNICRPAEFRDVCRLTLPAQSLPQIVVGAHGRCIVAVVDEMVGEQGFRTLRAFEVQTGRQIWSDRFEFAQDTLRFAIEPSWDAGHKLVAYGTFDGFRKVVEIGTGQVFENMSCCQNRITIGPEGLYWFCHPWGDRDFGSFSLSLFRNGVSEPIFSLQLGPETRGLRSSFSPDGRFLAWGDTDDTVSLCDLEQVQGRLGALGY